MAWLLLAGNSRHAPPYQLTANVVHVWPHHTHEWLYIPTVCFPLGQQTCCHHRHICVGLWQCCIRYMHLHKLAHAGYCWPRSIEVHHKLLSLRIACQMLDGLFCPPADIFIGIFISISTSALVKEILLSRHIIRMHKIEYNNTTLHAENTHFMHNTLIKYTQLIEVRHLINILLSWCKCGMPSIESLINGHAVSPWSSWSLSACGCFYLLA